MTAREKLIAHTAAQTTEHLIAGMLSLDGKVTGDFLAGLSPEEILVLHTIEDVLIQRFPAADAQIDTWMDDESEEGVKFVTDNSYAALVALAVDMAK